MFNKQDCDAKFGTLWKATFKTSILTPREYEEFVRKTLGKVKNMNIEVIDILICPDYINLMYDCIDREIKNVFKRERTMHQWIFTACSRDRNHLCGVHTDYRGYDQPYVFEIESVDMNITPQYTTDFRVHYVEVPTQPSADDPNEYIGFLKKFPTREIRPVGLYRNSSNNLASCLEEIGKYYGNRSQTYNEWKLFSEDNLPQTDNVRDYLTEIRRNSYVPLKEELFGKSLCHDQTSTINPTSSKVRTEFGVIDFDNFDGQPIPRSRIPALAPHKGYNKSNLPTRQIISDPAAAKTPAEAFELLLNKIMNFTVDSCTKEEFQLYLKKADITYKVSWNKAKLLSE